VFIRRIQIFGLILLWGLWGTICLADQPANPNSAEDVFGRNFVLTVDTSGTLKYNFSEKNELISIEAKRDVHLVSDKLELFCDKFNYDAKTKQLKAIGKRVKIIQAPIVATCGEFSYEPKTGRSELLKFPEILNKDEEGHKTSTKGDNIIIEREPNGDTLIQVAGNANLKSEAGSAATPKPAKAVEPAQKMFGRQFEILTGKSGELLYAFTKENELKSIVARSEVFLSSEQVDLSCNRFEFNGKENKLLAMGNPVKIFQKTLTARCGRFEYYPEEGKSILLEKPLIINKDEEGRTTETRGEKILILQAKEGETSILVEGSPSIESAAVEEKPAREVAKVKAPTPITESTVDKIKNVEVIEE